MQFMALYDDAKLHTKVSIGVIMSLKDLVDKFSRPKRKIARQVTNAKHD